MPFSLATILSFQSTFSHHFGVGSFSKLKQRLNEEESQLVTNCHQLKMTAQDGKKRLTNKLVLVNTDILDEYLESFHIITNFSTYEMN